MKCTLDWGCTCPNCKNRDHPMDRMARITPEELDKLYAAMPNRQGRQRSCYRCGTTRGLRRFGGGPFVCDAHKPSGQT